MNSNYGNINMGSNNGSHYIDNNGYIDIKEMYQAASMLGVDVSYSPDGGKEGQATLGMTKKQDELHEMFEIMDVNKTGRISEQEFITGWLNTKDDIILKNQLKMKFNVNVGDIEKGPGVLFG